MARTVAESTKRWLPTVRRMLYLVKLDNVADALGVDGPSKEMSDFAAETQKLFASLSKLPEYGTLSTADRQGAEAVFHRALDQATYVDVFRGIIDGPSGVAGRLVTKAVRAQREDLVSDDAKSYFDGMIAEVSNRLCTWLEDRPFDTDTLIVAATRTLVDQQDSRTERLLQEFESLVRVPSNDGERALAIQRLVTRAESSRGLLEPDVLPPRARLNHAAPESFGGNDLPFPLSITGDGGQGKSVLLGQIYDSQVARRQVVLILASQVPAGADISTPSLLDAELGRAAYGLPEAPRLTEILKPSSTGGPGPVLLIDTLDLILSDTSADAISQLLPLVSSMCDVLLTCRAREWDDLVGTAAAGWTDVRLTGLDEGDIGNWVDSYLATVDLPEARADSFRGSVASAARDKHLREVLAVPLRLAMACGLYADRGALPGDLSVTRLYSAYWDARVATDRRGRRGQAAMEQEVAVLELAGNLWQISHTRFSDTVAATANTIRVCRILLSEGILKSVPPRYTFFHQTFSEYAVARYLAAHGSPDDWATLEKALVDGSAGHWGTATHLVVGPIDRDRFNNLVGHIPRSDVLGARLLLRGALNRPPHETSELFEDLARTHPRNLVGATDLIEDVSDEWLDEVLRRAIAWAADPSLQSGSLVNAISTLILRSPEADRGARLELALKGLMTAGGPEFPAQSRRLLNRVLAPVDDAAPLPAVAALQMYSDLPEPARAEVLAAQASQPTTGADLRIVLTALTETCPSGAVDDAAAILLRCWHDSASRSALKWASWREVLAATYQPRWDAAQVRSVAQIAETDPAVLSQVVAAALSEQEISRERIHNTVHFLAEHIPMEIGHVALATPAAPHREAAGTFAVLVRTVAPAMEPRERRALIDRLRPYSAYDGRRVWPALVRAAIPEPPLLQSLLTEVAAVDDPRIRRSTFDTCLNALDTDDLASYQGLLRALVPSAEPPDRQLRAELDGFLAMDEQAARATVLRYMDMQPDAKEPLAAARSLVRLLNARKLGLGPEGSAFVLDLLDASHEHVVRTVAQCLADRIFILDWDAAAVSRIVVRCQQALRNREDAQVPGALKDLIGALLHAEEAPLSALVTPSVALLILDQYLETLEELYANPTSRTQPLTPALYVQTHQAVTALAVGVVPLEAVETYLRRLLVEFDTAVIAGRSFRALASTLVSFITRHPHRWQAVVDTAWPEMPEANKHAVAECLKRGPVPDAAARARAIAIRKDCPPAVAETLFKAFPD